MPPRQRAEPRWVDRVVLDAVHLDQIRAHGGLPGVRDENALEAALARARNKRGYEPTADVAVLGAAYAFGLVSAHPYRDGNKRIAFLAMVVILGLNGYDFDAPEPEVVTMMVAAADHRTTEAELATWIRGRMVALPADRSRPNETQISCICLLDNSAAWRLEYVAATGPFSVSTLSGIEPCVILQILLNGGCAALMF